MDKINKKHFTNVDSAIKFIKVLLENNQIDNYYKDQLKITTPIDGGVTIEFTNDCADSDSGWQYVDYDQVIMTRHEFPDGHYDYFFPEEVDEKVKAWHDAHPEWVLSDWGTWTNLEENRPFMIEHQLDKWLAHKSCPTTVDLELELSVETPIGVADYEFYDSLITEILRAATKEDVLKRTDFIVFAGDAFEGILADSHIFKKEDGFACSSNTIKLGSAYYAYNSRILTNTELIECKPSVYMDYRIDVVEEPKIAKNRKDIHATHILFMADNGYVIGDMRISLIGDIPHVEIKVPVDEE